MWNLKPTRIKCIAAYQDGISSRPSLPGSRVYHRYRCWDGLERVMIQRSIRLKGSKCVLTRSATAAVIGESPVTGVLGFYMLKNTSRCGFDEFLLRAWRECRRQNRRQAQVQPVWFGSKNMKLSVFNQFGFILGWADSLPDVVDDLLAHPAENIFCQCRFWDFHTLLSMQGKS